MQSTSYYILGWVKHKLVESDCQENLNNLRNADDATLMAESKEELRSFLMSMKWRSEKAGFKLNIQNINGNWLHHFIQIEGENWKQ